MKVILNFFMLSYEFVSSKDPRKKPFFHLATWALFTTVATLGAWRSSIKIVIATWHDNIDT